MNKLLLAAFLHDIGEFWRRTGEDLFPLEEEERSRPFYTKEFIEEFVAGEESEELTRLATSHRRPTGKRSLIIGLANRLSTGEWFEGIKDPGSADPGDSSEIPLMSIFSNLFQEEGSGERQSQPGDALYFPLSEISFDETTFFPREKFELTQEDYRNIWADFTAEIQHLRDTPAVKLDLEGWYYLFQKYLSRVPVVGDLDVEDEEDVDTFVPDVSLFDHSRTTAAIAACLDRLGLEKERLEEVWAGLEESSDKSAERMNEEDFLLVGGDISGVQSFIYSLTSDGAAKTLKGRSYYLQLLEEVVSNYVIDSLNLPRLNKIYSGGGRFYVLAPAKEIERLRQLQARVNEKMLRIHDGDLGLVLGWVGLSYADLLSGGLGPVWKKLAEEVGGKKRVKFRGQIKENPDDFFALDEKGGLESRCTVCTREASVDEEGRCSFCNSFERLGEEIAKKDFRIERRVPEAEGTGRTYGEVFQRFGYRYQLLNFDELYKAKVQGEGESGTARLHLLNDTDLENAATELAQAEAGLSASLGFEFVGQLTPFSEDGTIKDFDHLGQESSGIDRIGVLRADVDDLGLTFQRGLLGRMSLSRMASLSFHMSLFFEGWISKHLGSRRDLRDNLYLIYSGGDDLFLVGSWDGVIEASRLIRDSFARFTRRESRAADSLTISAGLHLMPVKYPVYKGSEVAGDLEERSKSHVRARATGTAQRERHKDAITFLDNTVGWGRLEEFAEIKEALREKLSPGSVPKESLPSWLGRGAEKEMTESELRKLEEIYQLYVRDKEGLERERLSKEELQEMAKFQRWRWRLVYLLKENHPQLLERILADDNIKHLDLAARWVDLLLR